MTKKPCEYKPISGEEWCAHAEDEVLQAMLQNDPVIAIYPAVALHFKRLEQLSWNDFLTGLHIVYAWMPRMLNPTPLANACEEIRSRVVTSFQKVCDGEILTTKETEMLVTFTNNSVVGFSKLAHFLAPSKYPIWDARVALAFLNRKPAYTYLKSIDAYSLYQKTLLKWCSLKRVGNTILMIRDLNQNLSAVSKTRILELVLWHKGANRI